MSEAAAVDTPPADVPEATPPANVPEATPRPSKPVGTLILDTNAFVKGLPVSHISGKFVTIPEVVQELRSRPSRDRYQELKTMYGIELLSPDKESIHAVSSFAKRTGDLNSLALADLRLLALAFMLEKQANGMRRLRMDPDAKQPNIKDRKLLANAGSAKAGQTDGGEQVEKSEEKGEVEQGSRTGAGAGPEPEADQTISSTEAKETTTEEIGAQLSQMTLSGDADDSDVLQRTTVDELAVPSDEEFDDGDDSGEEWTVAASKKSKKAGKEMDEFFNGSWITPSNVKQHQAADAMGLRSAQATRPAAPMKVACMTSDFAMQNVMLRMGINLVTPDGVRVRQLRTWVLRCHACYELTGDMGRQFCSSCGHATLKRCSVTTGTDGKLKVHLKANYNYNLRGTIYSLPKPRGGRHMTKDVITREDDRAYERAISHKKKQDAKAGGTLAGGAGSLLDDPDYIPDLLVSSLRANGNGYGVATDARGMPKVNRNRRNPNAARPTGNRKNKRLHV
ncbi:20S-pre-rRNA D-site endonuclease nob1 [Coemansia sp. RSA 552]|nr:20S-pre-rRNA D-site endonuclease nob1 [Coemansia sp. RSA 552]